MRALVSVSDKRGVEELARGLQRHGVEILSTGGTARGFASSARTSPRSPPTPARRRFSTGASRRCTRRSTAASSAGATPEHEAEMAEHGIEHDRSRGGEPLSVPRDGRARGRHARRGDREHRHRRAVDDPLGGEEPRARRGGRRPRRLRGARSRSSTRTRGRSRAALRFRLARKAFAYTAAYDGAIANWLDRAADETGDAARGAAGARAVPRGADAAVEGRARAALRREPAPAGGLLPRRGAARGPVGGARRGAAGQGALATTTSSTSTPRCSWCREFGRPAVAIIKHTNPCGAAESDDGVRGGVSAGARVRSGVARSAASSPPTAWSTTSSGASCRRPSSSA